MSPGLRQAREGLFLSPYPVTYNEMLGEGPAGHVDVSCIALNQPDARQQENLPDRFRNNGIGDELAQTFVRPEAGMQIGRTTADPKFVRLGKGTGIKHGRPDADC